MTHGSVPRNSQGFKEAIGKARSNEGDLGFFLCYLWQKRDGRKEGKQYSSQPSSTPAFGRWPQKSRPLKETKQQLVRKQTDMCLADMEKLLSLAQYTQSQQPVLQPTRKLTAKYLHFHYFITTFCSLSFTSLSPSSMCWKLGLLFAQTWGHYKLSLSPFLFNSAL